MPTSPLESGSRHTEILLPTTYVPPSSQITGTSANTSTSTAPTTPTTPPKQHKHTTTAEPPSTPKLPPSSSFSTLPRPSSRRPSLPTPFEKPFGKLSEWPRTFGSGVGVKSGSEVGSILGPDARVHGNPFSPSGRRTPIVRPQWTGSHALDRGHGHPLPQRPLSPLFFTNPPATKSSATTRSSDGSRDDGEKRTKTSALQWLHPSDGLAHVWICCCCHSVNPFSLRNCRDERGLGCLHNYVYIRHFPTEAVPNGLGRDGEGAEKRPETQVDISFCEQCLYKRAPPGRCDRRSLVGFEVPPLKGGFVEHPSLERRPFELGSAEGGRRRAAFAEDGDDLGERKEDGNGVDSHGSTSVFGAAALAAARTSMSSFRTPSEASSIQIRNSRDQEIARDGAIEQRGWKSEFSVLRRRRSTVRRVDQQGVIWDRDGASKDGALSDEEVDAGGKQRRPRPGSVVFVGKSGKCDGGGGVGGESGGDFGGKEETGLGIGL